MGRKGDRSKVKVEKKEMVINVKSFFAEILYEVKGRFWSVNEMKDVTKSENGEIYVKITDQYEL